MMGNQPTTSLEITVSDPFLIQLSIDRGAYLESCFGKRQTAPSWDEYLRHRYGAAAQAPAPIPAQSATQPAAQAPPQPKSRMSKAARKKIADAQRKRHADAKKNAPAAEQAQTAGLGNV